MKFPRLAPLVGVAVLLAASAIAAACGGDGDELTAAEYFTEVQAVSDDVNERFAANDAEIEEAFGDVEDLTQVEGELLDAFKENFANNVEIINDALQGIEDLNPPDEAQEAHDAFRAALAEFAGALEGFGERVADLEGSVDLEAFFAEPGNDFEEVDQRFTAACLTFQDVGQQYVADLNLDCADEEE